MKQRYWGVVFFTLHYNESQQEGWYHSKMIIKSGEIHGIIRRHYWPDGVVSFQNNLPGKPIPHFGD